MWNLGLGSLHFPPDLSSCQLEEGVLYLEHGLEEVLLELEPLLIVEEGEADTAAKEEGGGLRHPEHPPPHRLEYRGQGDLPAEGSNIAQFDQNFGPTATARIEARQS